MEYLTNMGDKSVKERLDIIAKHYKLSQRALSLKLKMSDGYINKIKDEISSEVIRNIFHILPEVNVRWLVTGEGEMLNIEFANCAVEPREELSILKYEMSELKKKNEDLIEKVGYWKAKAGVDLKSEPA